MTGQLGHLGQLSQPRDGIAIVDKAAGWTSHDVVAKARGLLHNRRIGHSGTLDPDATGVLILGVGRATRLLRYLTVLPKSYVGEIVLGEETTTLDSSGEVTAVHDMDGVTIDDVAAAAASLTGSILQVPPMVSAIQVDGRRLHEIAREGGVVERDPRPVVVTRFDVSAVPDQVGVYRAEVDCSSGTYVRSLAADLGRALGGGAHLRNLRRTAVGSFVENQAKPLEAIEVIPPVEAVRHLTQVVVDPEIAIAVGHGKVLNSEVLGIDLIDANDQESDLGSSSTQVGPWAVIDEHDNLLAVYEQHRDGRVKPAVVIAVTGVESASGRSRS